MGSSVNNVEASSASDIDLDAAVIVALGANLPGAYPSCEVLLDAAVAALAQEAMTVRARSSWWRSAAWPDASAPAYLNGVVLVETSLTPAEVILRLHAVEAANGPGPFEAVRRILNLRGDFMADDTREQHGLTFNPGGFLKRVS